MSIVLGVHAVDACLRNTPERVLRLSVQRDRHDATMRKLITLAREHNIQVSQHSRDAMNRMCDGNVHQGIAAHCQAFQPETEAAFEEMFETLENPFLLAIEGVQDPRNLGACLRSAAGAGVDGVLLPKHRSAPLSTTAFKSASGALSSLFVTTVSNLARRIEWLKERGVWVVGTDDKAEEPYTSYDYAGSLLVVVGSEYEGIRELTKANCDALVSIPTAGDMPSLNVSVATGVVLFECVRQRTSSKEANKS